MTDGRLQQPPRGGTQDCIRSAETHSVPQSAVSLQAANSYQQRSPCVLLQVLLRAILQVALQGLRKADPERQAPQAAGSLPDYRCRKEFRTYPDAFGYPYSPGCNYDERSAHFTGAFSGDNRTLTPAYFSTRPMRGWHWAELNGEHWLYAYSSVVAIVCGTEGGWQIRHPVTIPVQTATTLDAARKLAINVAFWTWPTGGIKPKPAPQEKITEAEWRERDAADARYVAADERRLRTEAVDASGNYAPQIDCPTDEGGA
jgi:hypothetical protein